MGGPDFDCGNSAVDLNGDVYTSCGFRGTSDFDPGTGTFNLTSAGDKDIFISKLDSNGNFVWAKRIGGEYDELGSVGVDPTGNVYITAGFSGTLDFDPGPGIFELTSAGATDIFVLKLWGSPSNLPPVADAGGPYTAFSGETITLNASGSSDPDGNPLSYEWDDCGMSIPGDPARAPCDGGIGVPQYAATPPGRRSIPGPLPENRRSSSRMPRVFFRSSLRFQPWRDHVLVWDPREFRPAAVPRDAFLGWARALDRPRSAGNGAPVPLPASLAAIGPWLESGNEAASPATGPLADVPPRSAPAAWPATLRTARSVCLQPAGAEWSAWSPALRAYVRLPVFLLPVQPLGTQAFIYNGDVSAPEGDSQDSIQFSPYSDPVFVSIECTGNPGFQAGLLENGQPVRVELACGDLLKPVPVKEGGVYIIHVQASQFQGGLQYFPYTIKIQASP